MRSVMMSLFIISFLLDDQRGQTELEKVHENQLAHQVATRHQQVQADRSRTVIVKVDEDPSLIRDAG